MSHQLYQQTIQQLSRSLEKKWKKPVEYLQQSYPALYCDKWLEKNNETIFPLLMNFQTAGHIKVASRLNTDQLNTTHHLIQWTLQSLEDVFKQYNTQFYTDSKEIYPLLIQSEDEPSSLKQAYELYEQSPARSFIHCHAQVWDRSFFSAPLDQTLIFISDLPQLSKENQMFLSHFIRTSVQNGKTPLIVSSIKEPFYELKRNSQILDSLLENFVSFRSNK